MERLPEGVRAVAYDVRGHGNSSVGDGQFSLEFLVDDLIGLLDHLNVEKVILCGLSMGGYIALRAVERHPERFMGLVLCDTQSHADTNEAKIKRANAIRLIKNGGIKEFADNFINLILAKKTVSENNKIVEQLRDMILHNDPLGVCGTFMALGARTDTSQSLPSFSLPVSIVVGENDALTPPSMSDFMHRKIPRSELNSIPAAGHMSNMENAEAFNEVLYRFVANVMNDLSDN